MTTTTDQTIVSAAIFPPIGIMRVGNSPDEYFIGPEVDEPIAQSSSYYRDVQGRLKRQAARFRIYGYNAAGEVVKELTADDATINWQAYLANQKSSWYKFELALDIPEAVVPKQINPQLRNADVADRNTLLIDGGSQSISGKSQTSEAFEGKFKEQSVYLGEMRTDEHGRLLMLGGFGVSANPDGNPATSFGNNEGWHDDMSDGPVTAHVEFDGKTLPVKPAWIVCAPPDYAPMQKSVRTMWDLMRDIAIDAGMLQAPLRPSFTRDILPLFQRQTDLQWVNAGFAAGFGWESNFDFSTPELLARLNSKSTTWDALRNVLSNNFRRTEVQMNFTPETSATTWEPKTATVAPQLWPWLYGDSMSTQLIESPRQFVSVTPLQQRMLSQWAKGDFIDDYDPAAAPLTAIEQVPVAEQPDMLTKAAMDYCLADAFHPGCEMTWPMRSIGMYMEAFRLRHAADTSPVHGTNFGSKLTPQVAMAPGGPVNSGQIAGSITRWMAVPWQTDTASCRDGYNAAYDPYLPTFWPARVPNNMLDKTHYEYVIDERNTLESRQAAFNDRTFWLDDLPVGPNASYEDQINSMVTNFGDLAVVLEQQQSGVVGFPESMQVGISKKDFIHTEVQPEDLDCADEEIVEIDEALVFSESGVLQQRSSVTKNIRGSLQFTEKAGHKDK